TSVKTIELVFKYLTKGKRIIHITIFIEENGKEVYTWGPDAESTKQHVAQYQQQLPPKDAPDYEEKFKQFIKQVTKALREETDIWNSTYKIMKQTIEKIKQIKYLHRIKGFLNLLFHFFKKHV